jgi:uncharacterized RDD family membrane protein YckC
MHPASLQADREPMRAAPRQVPLSRSAHTNNQPPFGKPAGLARRLAAIALAGATLSLATIPVQAVTLFAGDYSPAKWTQNVQGDDSIDTGVAPTALA